MLSQKEESVTRVLFKLCGWVGKGYCFPSQRKIVKLSAKWHSVPMSRRTLNRVLGRLESDGYLARVRRHHKGEDGQLVMRSTLYKLGGRAFNHVYNLGAWAGRVFSVFRVPKMAQYKVSTSARYLHPVEKGGEDALLLSKGPARAAPIFLQIKTV